MKSVMIGPETWLVWNFDRPSDTDIKMDLEINLPEFMRVRELVVKRVSDDKNYISYDCGERVRCELPCSCFFRIADNGFIEHDEIVDIGMIDLRYLKVYNAHYGEESVIGDLIFQAQEECFEHEDFGIKVSNSYLSKLVGENDEEYPKLGPNTSEDDITEALFVYKQDTCIRIDLELFRMEHDGDVNGAKEIRQLIQSRISEKPELGHVEISPVAKSLHNRMRKSCEATIPESELLQSEKEVFDMRKSGSTLLMMF